MEHRATALYSKGTGKNAYPTCPSLLERSSPVTFCC